MANFKRRMSGERNLASSKPARPAPLCDIMLTVVEVAPGRFDAYVDGRCIVSASAHPFEAAAQALIVEGRDPNRRMIMRQAGDLDRQQVDRAGTLAGAVGYAWMAYRAGS